MKPKETLRSRIILAVILLLAFLLRFAQPTLVEFKRDEPTVSRLAQAIAYEGYRPAVGVAASVGPDNLPLNLYLMALPIRLWDDPLAAVLFAMLLNWLAVWGCYALGKLYFGTEIGLIAALLFAVNPWAVLYARKIWSLSMPWATLIFFATLYLTFVRGRRWALVAALLAGTVMLGLHLSGLAVILIMGLALLLYRDQVSPQALLIGLTLSLIAVAPYILHDAFHHWENLRGFLAYAGRSSSFSWNALRFAFILSGSEGIDGQAGPFHEQFRAAVPPLWWMNGAMMLLLGLALAYAVWQSLRAPTQAQRRTFGLLLMWFFVPVALQLSAGATTQLHYFVILYPVQFLLVAKLLVEGLRRIPPARLKWGQAALVISLLVWSTWQMAITYQLHTYMAQHPSTGGYGIPLKFKREAAHLALNAAGEAEIIVVSDSNRPFVAETPTVFDSLLFGHPHRFTDGRTDLPVPSAPRVVYLVGPLRDAPDEPLTPMVQRLSSWPTVTAGPSVRLPDGVSYRIFIRQSQTQADVTAKMQPLAAGVPFANHAVFVSYQAPAESRPGESLTVWLAWWVQNPPPERQDYHFTVQLLDSEGQLRTQNDHAGFPSDYWRTGDVVLSRFEIPLPDDLPSGLYNLRAGMYSYPDIAAVPVIDPSGSPTDDGVTLAFLPIR